MRSWSLFFYLCPGGSRVCAVRFMPFPTPLTEAKRGVGQRARPPPSTQYSPSALPSDHGSQDDLQNRANAEAVNVHIASDVTVSERKRRRRCGDSPLLRGVPLSISPSQPHNQPLGGDARRRGRSTRQCRHFYSFDHVLAAWRIACKRHTFDYSIFLRSAPFSQRNKRAGHPA